MLNAIEHANYFFRSNIKIEFFEDRLEILNPGNFYGGITLEQAKHGVQSFRNPKLVYVLDKLGFVENYATGIETIFKTYESEELNPSFKISETHTSVILPNLIYAFESENSIVGTSNVHENVLDVHENVHNVHENVHDVHENVHENVHDVHENVLEKPTYDIIPTIIDAIRLNPVISLEELAGLTGKSKRTIQRIIKNSDQIKRIGPNKGGHWKIIDKESH